VTVGPYDADLTPMPPVPPGSGQLGNREYEGHAKYADGSIWSLQCFEGRHGDCPDDHDSDEGNGSCAGYSCECSCSGEGDDRPVTVLLRRIKAVEQPDGSWPGIDVVDVLTQFFTEQGYVGVVSADDVEDTGRGWNITEPF
jgi:hypothetical protein